MTAAVAGMRIHFQKSGLRPKDEERVLSAEDFLSRPIVAEVTEPLTSAGLASLTIVGLLGNTALESSQAAASSGQWQSAERHARSAIRWLPWSAAGWQSLAEAQLALNDRAGALLSLRRAIAKDPNDWVLWLDLVGASRGKQQVAAAEHAYRLNPLDPSLIPYIVAVAGS